MLNIEQLIRNFDNKLNSMTKYEMNEFLVNQKIAESLKLDIRALKETALSDMDRRADDEVGQIIDAALQHTIESVLSREGFNQFEYSIEIDRTIMSRIIITIQKYKKFVVVDGVAIHASNTFTIEHYFNKDNLSEFLENLPNKLKLINNY